MSHSLSHFTFSAQLSICAVCQANGNETFYELAKLLPEHIDGEVGRSREFPDYKPFLFDALISVYGSARKVEAELGHRYIWKFIRRLVKRCFPDDPSMHLPARRHKRRHYDYARNRYLTDPEIFSRIQEGHRRVAADQARELGLVAVDGEGSFTHPSLDRLVYADGKVVAPLYKAKAGDVRVDKKTGEVRSPRRKARLRERLINY